MANDLTLQDLYARVGKTKIDGYFDDSFNGSLTEESSAVNDVLTAAEGIFYSIMMRAYPGNPNDVGGGIRALYVNDPAVRVHVSWIAVEMAAERKTELCDSEGWGPHKAQYARAVEFLENLSKGLIRSGGEAVAGKGANTGGNLQPREVFDTGQEFIFAPGRNAPGGRGGF